ncbi:D-aminoacyl-tRNA deacylase [Turneriella parva]|uniref:D-aminoacyl-tRNA deacylase n=1 Tax=Turneriella parva (strain ATCC BAA-1111 / DSM 21527 / NCTC 11395 / H) TaxID=869212 RepID=I4B2L6_TURPD|nr:D-aminoacyl-tRNA deacylase [Turneriella parva]AFM11523.1 D-tyrosyl-tRNA(Tyr) deacylase [Turneriella parva DSM 21527]
MVALLQRVRSAAVDIAGERVSEIGPGLLVLLGVGHDDHESLASALAKKTAALRIFSDEAGKMNLSVADIQGEVLVVSQFTLMADTQKGNRPSFVDAAKAELAIPLYEFFVAELGQLLGKEIKTGRFAADMQVSLVNDGPVTIWLKA